MAKVKSTGYADTPLEGGATALTFPRGLLNLNTDFRVKSNNPGEVVLVNTKSPVDRPERVRIAYTDIQNVYSGTGIEPSVAAPTKRGISVLAQVTEVISVTDSVDPNYRVDLPVSFHLVIKVPSSEHISADDIQTGLGRLLSTLYDEGSTSTSRLEAVLRGSLVPTGM